MQWKTIEESLRVFGPYYFSGCTWKAHGLLQRRIMTRHDGLQSGRGNTEAGAMATATVEEEIWRIHCAGINNQVSDTLSHLTDIGTNGALL